MKSPIKFGTDGWRARIAEDFTFDNLRLVTQALAEYLKEKGTDKKGIAVGFDNRFQSEDFAKAAAEVCSGAGIKTFISNRSLPSPVLSYYVKSQNLAAGIMLTASHNPFDWNGFKIKEEFGGSAFPETTRAVEQKLRDELKIKASSANIETRDFTPPYFAKINSLVDLNLIKNQRLKIMLDPMHGSGAGYFKALGLPAIEIRGERDPLFGGVNPEPIPVNLEETFSFVRETALKYSSEISACIVLDGDADRLAAVDSSGNFINTHQVFALLLHHLIVHRKISGNVVKTFNVSNLVDRLCQKHARKLYTTPIGFKYIAAKMLSEDILLGGEESGGMGIKGFIPERDGVLAGLMLCELMAYEKKSLGKILESLMEEHGYFYYDRKDLHTEQAQAIVKKISAQPPKQLGKIKVKTTEDLDGFKLILEDDSWILFRASGTEPLLRVYVEAKSEENLLALQLFLERFLLSDSCDL